MARRTNTGERPFALSGRLSVSALLVVAVLALIGGWIWYWRAQGLPPGAEYGTRLHPFLYTRREVVEDLVARGISPEISSGLNPIDLRRNGEGDRVLISIGEVRDRIRFVATARDLVEMQRGPWFFFCDACGRPLIEWYWSSPRIVVAPRTGRHEYEFPSALRWDPGERFVCLDIFGFGTIVSNIEHPGEGIAEFPGMGCEGVFSEGDELTVFLRPPAGKANPLLIAVALHVNGRDGATLLSKTKIPRASFGGGPFVVADFSPRDRLVILCEYRDFPMRDVWRLYDLGRGETVWEGNGFSYGLFLTTDVLRGQRGVASRDRDPVFGGHRRPLSGRGTSFRGATMKTPEVSRLDSTGEPRASFGFRWGLT